MGCNRQIPLACSALCVPIWTQIERPHVILRRLFLAAASGILESRNAWDLSRLRVERTSPGFSGESRTSRRGRSSSAGGGKRSQLLFPSGQPRGRAVRFLRTVSVPLVRFGDSRPPPVSGLFRERRRYPKNRNRGNSPHDVRFLGANVRDIAFLRVLLGVAGRRSGGDLYDPAPVERAFKRGASHPRPFLYRGRAGRG